MQEEEDDEGEKNIQISCFSDDGFACADKLNPY